jgi:cytidine deaminase
MQGEMMSHVKESKVTELDLPTQELYDLAREASTSAYAPYSEFQVGAALRTMHGAVFRGCNVENASYGLTCCAERSAVFAAVAAEGSDMRIQEVAVYVNTGTASPCGACRQVIAEFGTDVRILFTDGNQVVDTNIVELLPSHFVPPV